MILPRVARAQQLRRALEKIRVLEEEWWVHDVVAGVMADRSRTGRQYARWRLYRTRLSNWRARWLIGPRFREALHFFRHRPQKRKLGFQRWPRFRRLLATAGLAFLFLSQATATRADNLLTLAVLIPATTQAFTIDPAGAFSTPLAPSTEKYNPDPSEWSPIAAMPTFIETQPPGWTGGITGIYTDTINLTDTGNPVTNMTNLQAAYDGADTNSTLITVAGGLEGRLRGRYHPIRRAAAREVHILGNLLTANAGTRVEETDRAQLNFWQQKGTNTAAFDCDNKANDVRISGFQVWMDPTLLSGSRLVQNLFTISPRTSFSVLAELPIRIFVDRCVGFGWDVTGRFRSAQGVVNVSTHGTRNFVRIDAVETAVIDSACYNIWQHLTESHGIEQFRGQRTKIVNNYVEASSIGSMMGGAMVGSLEVLISDVEIRRNFFTKSEQWRQAGNGSPVGPDWDDQKRLIKNGVEIKNAAFVFYEGNKIWATWDQGSGGQPGYPYVFKSPQQGSETWQRCEDVYVRWAWNDNVSQMLCSCFDAQVKRIHWEQVLTGPNLNKGIYSAVKAASFNIYIANSTEDVRIENMTAARETSFMDVSSSKMIRPIVSGGNLTVCEDFEMFHCILPACDTGINGSAGSGVPTLDADFRDLLGISPTWDFGPADGTNCFYGNLQASGNWPSGTSTPLTEALAFRDFAGGDYRGKVGEAWEDSGCDVEQLYIYLAGV